jgi:hypothetical protein
MTGTRRTTRAKKEKQNQSLIELDFDPIMNEAEESLEEEEEELEEQMTPVSMQEDKDPIWERLSRLPFFQTATKKTSGRIVLPRERD